jgi:D-alanyl-D-alanine carboxypeptidase
MFGKQRIGPGVKFVEMYAPYAEGMKTGFICASGFNIVGSATRDGRRLIAVALGFRRSDLRDEFMVRLFDEAFASRPAAIVPSLAAAQRRRHAAHRCSLRRVHSYRYDYPGDAVWLGTYGDWRTAKAAFDKGQATLAELGVTVLGKEWILPVTANKVTRQAAVIADLQPEAAARLCASYQSKKLFCDVKKSQEIVAPFGIFWR